MIRWFNRKVTPAVCTQSPHDEISLIFSVSHWSNPSIPHPKKYSAYHVLLFYIKALHLTFIQYLHKLWLHKIVVYPIYPSSIISFEPVQIQPEIFHIQSHKCPAYSSWHRLHPCYNQDVSRKWNFSLYNLDTISWYR